MNSIIMLDTGPLGMIIHPRPNKDIGAWFKGLLKRGASIVVPEIADYEVRRSLIHIDSQKSIRRLNDLKTALKYMPLDTEIMLKAAELWAFARKEGKPTADPKELDGDVILAAQALKINAVVATENVGHLDLFVEAKRWSDIP